MKISTDLLIYEDGHNVLLYNHYSHRMLIVSSLLHKEMLEDINQISCTEEELSLLIRDGMIITDDQEYQRLDYYPKYQNSVLTDNKRTVQNVYFHITQRCNLKCEYCYNAGNLGATNELSMKDINLLLLKLKDIGAKCIVLTGGECLLRKDIMEICEAIKSEQFRLEILTNGTYLKQRRNAIEFADHIIISIDTFNENNNHRIGLNINQLRNDLTELQEDLKSKISIRSVIQNGKDDWKEVRDFCSQNGFDFIGTAYIPNKADEISCVPGQGTWDELSKNEEASLMTRHCGATCSEIAINIDGCIYPCQMLIRDEFQMGSLDEYINQEHDDIMRLFTERTFDKVHDCYKCNYKYLCGGGCPATAYYISKNINSAPKHFCDMFRYQIDKQMRGILNKYGK